MGLRVWIRTCSLSVLLPIDKQLWDDEINRGETRWEDPSRQTLFCLRALRALHPRIPASRRVPLCHHSEDQTTVMLGWEFLPTLVPKDMTFLWPRTFNPVWQCTGPSSGTPRPWRADMAASAGTTGFISRGAESCSRAVSWIPYGYRDLASDVWTPHPREIEKHFRPISMQSLTLATNAHQQFMGHVPVFSFTPAPHPNLKRLGGDHEPLPEA